MKALRRLLPFCLSSLLLTVVLIPGCLKKANTPLDGGHLILNDQETHWVASDFPLVLLVDKNMPDHIIKGIYMAASVWNIRTGVGVFAPVLMDFMEELPSGCGWIAAVEKEYDDDKDGLWRAVEKPGTSQLCAGEVSLRVGITHAFSAKLWIHELGHSLGLAHDHGDRRSIMHPTVYSDVPQYIMPDDAASVHSMVVGTFIPMSASLKSRLHRFLWEL